MECFGCGVSERGFPSFVAHCLHGVLVTWPFVSPSPLLLCTFSRARADRPDPVRDVTSTRMDRALRVSWDPPANSRGCPVLHFDVTVYVGFNLREAGSTKGVPPHTHSAVVEGLQNSVQYIASVTAVNAMGRSDASLARHQVPAGVPLAPRLAPVVRAANDITGLPAARVAFAPAPHNGRPVLRYFVQGMAHRWKAGRGALVRNGSVLLRMVTTEQAVDGQDPLLLEVAARDREALGEAANGDSSAGSDSDGSGGGREDERVAWQVAEGDGAGSAVGGGGADVRHMGGGDTHPLQALVPKLLLGGYYRFRVWGENEVGVGPRSDWSSELCAIGTRVWCACPRGWGCASLVRATCGALMDAWFPLCLFFAGVWLGVRVRQRNSSTRSPTRCACHAWAPRSRCYVGKP